MTDRQITDACRKHGAKVISDAAYAAMDGRQASLAALGLDASGGLAAMHRITVIAYGLMDDDDQAADLTDAAISGMKI